MWDSIYHPEKICYIWKEKIERWPSSLSDLKMLNFITAPESLCRPSGSSQPALEEQHLLEEQHRLEEQHLLEEQLFLTLTLCLLQLLSEELQSAWIRMEVV